MALAINVLGGPVQLSGNPVGIEVTGAAAPAGSTGYKVLLRVNSIDNKLEKAPFEDAVTPMSGKAEFDISSWVDQPVAPVFEYPCISKIKAYATQAFNVTVWAGEMYWDENNVFQESYTVMSDMFQLLKGGVANRQLDKWEEDNTNFYETYISGGKFLTMRPQGDTVLPGQPVKLWFMPSITASATLRVTARYYDEERIEADTAVDFNTDSLYEINCIPELHGLPSEHPDSGARILFFTVQVMGAIETDERGFFFNWTPCERPVFMLYANSIGGIDDVGLVGAVQESLALQGSTVEFPRRRGQTTQEATIKKVNNGVRNTWVVNTGKRLHGNMFPLRDLFASGQVWFLRLAMLAGNRKVIPVNIMNSKVLLLDWLGDFDNIDIEFEEGHSGSGSFDSRIN